MYARILVCTYNRASVYTCKHASRHVIYSWVNLITGKRSKFLIHMLQMARYQWKYFARS